MINKKLTEMKKDAETEKRPEIDSFEAPFIHIDMDKKRLDKTEPNIEGVLDYLRNNRDNVLKMLSEHYQGKVHTIDNLMRISMEEDRPPCHHFSSTSLPYRPMLPYVDIIRNTKIRVYGYCSKINEYLSLVAGDGKFGDKERAYNNVLTGLEQLL